MHAISLLFVLFIFVEYLSKMKKALLIGIIVGAFLLFLNSCSNENTITVDHSFTNNLWDRFEKINIIVPIEDLENRYDFYFEIEIDSTYIFPNLYMNVVLYMPSGEERINEYDFQIKNDDGSFKVPLDNNGTGRMTFLLRKELRFNRAGNCLFEFENLIPRVEIPGIHKIGITRKVSEN
jgi:gliding motility-associated lipoprotein GldH